MEEDVQEYYRKHEDFHRYLIENEKRVEEIGELCEQIDAHIGERVLDIACGGGILGFLLEPEGHDYTGIDINPDAIEGAEKYAEETGSDNRFILGDAMEADLEGEYDTLFFIGNSPAHLTASEYIDMLDNLDGNVREGTTFITDYRDVVELLFEGEWMDELTQEVWGREVEIETTGCDTEEGKIYQEAEKEGEDERIESYETIWSPFIMEALMKARDWELVERGKAEEWQGWLDVYEKR